MVRRDLDRYMDRKAYGSTPGKWDELGFLVGMDDMGKRACFHPDLLYDSMTR